MAQKADIRVITEGNMLGFQCLSKAGLDYLTSDEVISEGWQWLGQTLYVDHRLATDLFVACDEQGLTIDHYN